MNTFEIKKILIPVDFSATGEKVLEQASFMSKITNAQITLVHAIADGAGKTGPDYNGVPIDEDETDEGKIKQCSEDNMSALKKKLFDAGVNNIDCIIEPGTPHKKILEVAKRIKTDIIIMGTHGVSGFKEFIMGSNTFKVASEAKCPVLSIQKHTTKQGFKNILLPFRDRPHSREKVDYAISIAKIYNATIHVLGISFDKDPGAVKKIDKEADQIVRIADILKVKCTKEIVTESFDAKYILAHAREKNADLLVLMADLDKLALSQFVMGPVIKQLVNHSPIPVLSIHPAYNPHPVVDSGAGVNVSDWTFWT